MSMENGRKKKKILQYAGIGLCVLAALVPLVFFGLRAAGRSSLRNRAVTGSPILSENAADTETGGENEGIICRNGVKYRYNENLYTILCMGIDVRMLTLVQKAETGQGTQSDANFLLVIDNENKKISIVAIPRDTMTDIDLYDDGKCYDTVNAQLALQYAYGDGGTLSCTAMQKAVSRLFYNIPIHAYVAIDMNVIPVVNDAVGGVTVEVLENIVNDGNPMMKGQTVTLMGEQATVYVQSRDTGVDFSAQSRLMRQKQYLTAFTEQAMRAVKEDITLPVSVYNAIQPYMITDITSSELTYLATSAVGCDFSEDNFYVVPGEQEKGNFYEEYHVDEDALTDLILDVFYITAEK